MLDSVKATMQPFSSLTEKLDFLLPRKNIFPLIDGQNRIASCFPVYSLPMIEFSKINFDLFNRISEIGRQFKENTDNNPELQFAFISDLEILNLESTVEFKQSLVSDMANKELREKEEILNRNLLPHLEELKIDSLWIGANQVLKSKTNPDKLRHCLVSLRTILEYLIFLPNKDLTFKGKQKRLSYLFNNLEFKLSYLEETKNDVEFILECYSVLCSLHQPDIGLTEKQVRILKIKTGITIWLLAYLFQASEKNKIKHYVRTTNHSVAQRTPASTEHYPTN